MPAIKMYCIRVLEIEYDENEYKYHQLETNEHHGPFPSLESMLKHVHDQMFEDIEEAIQRQYH